MQIILTPHPALFKKAEAVKTIDAKVKNSIADMRQTLLSARDPKGIGLAAPQVGIPLRLFIVKLNEKEPFHVFINPHVLKKSSTLHKGKDLLEGCLSIPKIWGPVKRHTAVTVRFQDENGKTKEQTFEDLMATVIQHEIDHLEGILFTSRALEQHGKLFRVVKNEKGEEEFKEVEI